MRESSAPQGSPTRLDQVLASSAVTSPERAAIVDGSIRLIYAEFDAAVSRTANLLLSRGLGRGDRVALDALNGVEFAICYYAILRADGVVVPLNVLIGARLLAQRLEDSGAAALICVAGPDGLPGADTARAAVERVPTCRDLILIDAAESSLDNLTRAHPATPRAAQFGSDDAAVISYPRRTPGIPKGVVLTHTAMLHNASVIAHSLYGASTPDVHLSRDLLHGAAGAEEVAHV